MPDYRNLKPIRPPAKVPPSEAPSLRVLSSLAVSVVIVSGLYFGRQVLIPITLAVLLSFLLAPMVGLLRRIRFAQTPAVLLSVVLALAVILAIGAAIGTQIATLAEGIPHYQNTVESKLDAARQRTIGRIERLVGRARGDAERSAQGRAASRGLSSSGRTDASTAIPVEVHEPAPSPVELGRRFLSPVVGPLETTGIVFVVAIFILLQREDLRDRLIRLFGSTDLHRTTTAMDDAASRLSRYFITQVGINAGVGCVVGAGLFAIGVPSPGLFGILAGLLRFVPYVGTWMAAGLAITLAAAVEPGWSLAIWTLCLFIVVDVVAGQIVEPMVYGHSTGLSPFSVIVAAIFWSWLWGPIGLILSTPLTLCLVVLGRHVDRLEFLDVLLGDRPALTPSENFYQRALAGDADEALEQAEILLRDRPLVAYYDEVALRALRLAANDVSRGVVTTAQLERIETATHDLIDGLEAVKDGVPNPARASFAAEESAFGPSSAEQRAREQGEAGLAEPAPEAGPHRPRPVLCVTGRGPLDSLACAMLVQLLDRAQLESKLAPPQAVSRTEIGKLDIARDGVVVLFTLEISGIPSSMRYLIRRVRDRLPDATIVVGVWPEQEPAGWSDDFKHSLGADCYASSLREIVEFCLNPPPPRVESHVTSRQTSLSA